MDDHCYKKWNRYLHGDVAPGSFDFSKYAQSYPCGGVRFTTGDFSDLGDTGFSDFFEMLFGRSGAGMGGNARAGAGNSPYYSGGRGRTAPRQGEDYQHDIDVTLEEAFSGTQRVLQMEAP